MKKIRIKYFYDDIEKLQYIDGKSDWIDLRAAEDVEMKAGEFRLIPLGIAMEICKNDRICQFRIMEHQPALEFESVDVLGHKDRGGLGSTGKQ